VSSPSRRGGAIATTLLVVALAGAGCSDLDRFSTAEGEAYCGRITLGSAFRQGFSPRVQMRLYLDASNVDGPDSPGTLSTYEAASEVTPERRVLTEAPLSVIQPLRHDPLSQLSFGDGRERNAVYGVVPDAPDEESLLAVLSLRADDTVEVRLMRPGHEPASGEDEDDGRRRLFGLFSLTKKEGDCGF
jgi:hypothetical protein